MRAGTAIALITCCLATPAHAQLIDSTPDTFGKVKLLAETARANSPTPTDAVSAMEAAFIAEFGDVRAASATIVDSTALSVRVITPIHTLYLIFANALRNRSPLPDHAPPSYVAIHVRPSQHDAPNVTRVALFLDGHEVPPETNNLKPSPISNWQGGVALKGSGVVAWKSDVFTTPGVVKVRVITDGPVFEWEYSAGKPPLR